MRYIIIDPHEGVFLGTKSEPHRNGVKVMVLFSRNNHFEITKAVCWKTIKEAEEYLTNFIGRGFPEAYVAEVNVKTDFVDIIDLVKAGYGDHAIEMFEALPMENISIH
jgi:hypothetical protein